VTHEKVARAVRVWAEHRVYDLDEPASAQSLVDDHNKHRIQYVVPWTVEDEALLIAALLED
jgi:hypothetical protein